MSFRIRRVSFLGEVLLFFGDSRGYFFFYEKGGVVGGWIRVEYFSFGCVLELFGSMLKILVFWFNFWSIKLEFL